MQAYLDLLDHVLTHGHRKDDRTGTGTVSVFGWQSRYRLMMGFRLSRQRNCTSNRLFMNYSGLSAGIRILPI